MPASSAVPEFESSYAGLPDLFHQRLQPTPVRAPSLVRLNDELARSLGLDPGWLASPDGLAMLAGNHLPPSARPLAMAYAGHQFGNWVARLGDGRALLIGEIIDRDGIRRDLQLKGAGPTLFSRGGDGRSSIGPVVREYLASEAMAALGIPTTRALAAVATGETVQRQKPEPGGVLCRVATSHVRIGTFEYFARQGQTDAVRTLADYVVRRHFPDLLDSPRPWADLLGRVVERTASLVAAWMSIGFIHGVMNTDNCSIVGETLDYGPFGFLDEFHPDTVYSFIDRQGRYAWKQQPAVANWNLARLAESLLGLLDERTDRAVEIAEDVLARFAGHFSDHFDARLTARIGLAGDDPDDAQLALALLECMARNRADMTLTFRRLSALSSHDSQHDGPVRELFQQPGEFDAWARQWRSRLQGAGRADRDRQEAMRAVNPAFVLRNHLAQRAVDAAIDKLDFAPMDELARVLARPFDDQPEAAHLALPPRPSERVTTTFCGT